MPREGLIFQQSAVHLWFNFVIICLMSFAQQTMSEYCAAGYYSSTGTDSPSSCASCSSGYFSTTGSTSCDVTLHNFDFRGCTTGSTITDDWELAAIPNNGPSCSAAGIYFDGSNDYVELDDWSWGGDISVEIYVKYASFQDWSFIFSFYDKISGVDNFIRALNTGSSASSKFYGEFPVSLFIISHVRIKNSLLISS